MGVSLILGSYVCLDPNINETPTLYLILGSYVCLDPNTQYRAQQENGKQKEAQQEEMRGDVMLLYEICF